MKRTLPKVDIAKLRNGLLASIIAVLIFIGGFTAGRNGFVAQKALQGNISISREVPLDKNLDFSLFWRVWDILFEKYLTQDNLDVSDMVYGAIKGMVGSIGDPYTVFLSPSENRVVQEDLNGDLEGVGIQIGFKGTQLSVIAPLSGTPAEKAGLKAGDAIIGIKDEVKGIDRGTAGITIQEAVQAIRGPRGSIVTLLVLRDGVNEPIEFEITRAKIDTASVEIEILEGGIARLSVLKFTGDTLDEWESAVDQVLANNGVNSIILDLRNNPGGFLQGSVDIAAEFLGHNQLVVIEQSSLGETNEFRTDRLGRLTDYNIVVLVNEGSASASEILAGALRDQLGVEIIGQTTFGKGTIQEPLQMENGSALHITTAKWLLPKGEWIDKTGITPSVEVEDDLETEEDEQLQKAIDQL